MGKTRTESTEEGFHYMPDDGPHEASADCPCGPTLTWTDPEDGRGTWVHKWK